MDQEVDQEVAEEPTLTQDIFKTMNDIFFNLQYESPQSALIKTGIFVLVSIFLLWLIYFVLVKLLFRKSGQRKEISLRLVFLWTIIAYFILFNVYVFVLFLRTGADSLNFSSGRFYLGIIAQLTIYVGLLIIFFIKRSSLKEILNAKSVN